MPCRPRSWPFRADGTRESEQTVTKYKLNGTYRWLTDRTVELTTVEPKSTHTYHVTVTKGGRLDLLLVADGSHSIRNQIPEVLEPAK